MAGLNQNDRVELRVHDGNVIIIPLRKHKSLADRISEYQGEYNCQEWDTGKAVGDEVL